MCRLGKSFFFSSLMLEVLYGGPRTSGVGGRLPLLASPTRPDAIPVPFYLLTAFHAAGGPSSSLDFACPSSSSAAGSALQTSQAWSNHPTIFHRGPPRTPRALSKHSSNLLVIRSALPPPSLAFLCTCFDAFFCSLRNTSLTSEGTSSRVALNPGTQPTTKKR